MKLHLCRRLIIGLSIFAWLISGCSNSVEPTLSLPTITPYGQAKCDLISKQQLEEITAIHLVTSRIGVLGSGAIICNYNWADDTQRRLSLLRNTFDSVDEAIAYMQDSKQLWSTDVPYATDPVIPIRQQRFQIVGMGDEAFIHYETVVVNENKISRGILWMRKDASIYEVNYDIYLPTEQEIFDKLEMIANALLSNSSSS